VVEHVEPAALAEVGALTGDLEGEPLIEGVALLYVGVGEFFVGVVLLDEVLDYRCGFLEDEVVIGVLGCLQTR
jgi:hypothetical protein